MMNNMPGIDIWKKLMSLLVAVLLFLPGLNAQRTIDDWLTYIAIDDTLNRAQWSIYAEYAGTGEPIIDYHSKICLAPASSLKIVTTGLTLVKLGPDFQFSTQLYYSGSINRKGILNGNLIIVGGGDPTLGSEMVPGSLSLDSLTQTWTKAISAAGIKRINGAVISDVSLLEEQAVPDYWPWIDIGNYYGAGTSALCIHDNLYYLTFKPGAAVGDPATVLAVVPQIPGLKFINHMRTGPEGSGDNGYIYCAPGQFTATLRGTVPAGVEEFTIKGSIPKPALLAAQLLSNALVTDGIKISGEARINTASIEYNQNKLIHRNESPLLKDIVRVTNQKSVNLYTEQLLKFTAWKESGSGSLDSGFKLIEAFLDTNKIDALGWRLYDASGLSRTNRVSARQLSNFLSLMSQTPVFEDYYNSFSIAGDPEGIGFVKSFGKGSVLALNGRIKTGLISGVRSHSGYLTTNSGRLVAFSFICNNYPVSTRRINKIHEAILVQLAMQQ